jgi:hypothetical protein
LNWLKIFLRREKMKRKSLMVLECIFVILLFLIPVSSHAQRIRPEVMVTHLHAPVGSGFYEQGVATDDLLRKFHPWLRTSTIATQGHIHIYKMMINEPERRKNTIFSTDLGVIFLAEQKKDPFSEGLKGLETKALRLVTAIPHFWMTLDPNIKTLQDFAGKRVASTPVGGTANFVSMALLEAAGLLNKIKVQHMGFGSMPDVLLDRLADVSLAGAIGNPLTKDFKPIGYVLQLQSARDTYLIGYGATEKEVLDLITKAGLKGKVFAVSLPPLGGKQQTPLIAFENVCFDAVDASFPEDIAYEFVKTTIDKLNDLKTYGGLNSPFTKEYLLYRIKDILHPGALKAYKEAGLVK